MAADHGGERVDSLSGILLRLLDCSAASKLYFGAVNAFVRLHKDTPSVTNGSVLHVVLRCLHAYCPNSDEVPVAVEGLTACEGLLSLSTENQHVFAMQSSVGTGFCVLARVLVNCGNDPMVRTIACRILSGLCPGALTADVTHRPDAMHIVAEGVVTCLAVLLRQAREPGDHDAVLEVCLEVARVPQGYCALTSSPQFLSQMRRLCETRGSPPALQATVITKVATVHE